MCAMIAGAVGDKSTFADGLQVDTLSENTVGHGVRVKGVTDPTTYPVLAGDVGEVVEAALTSTSVGLVEADVNGASIALTAGVWQIYYSVTAYYTTGTTIGNTGYTQVCITDSANTHIGRSERIIFAITRVAAANEIDTCLSASTVVNLSAPKTYKLRCKRTDAAGTGVANITVSPGNYDSTFFAVRIA